jgi:hypothetical protein
MRTYYLIFDGNPKSLLEPLRRIDSIKVLTIRPSLHCINLGSKLLERMVVNSLARHAPQENDVFLVPAQLPIHPAPPKQIEAEIRRMIDESNDADCIFLRVNRLSLELPDLVGAASVHAAI